jgi:hypothetical protein
MVRFGFFVFGEFWAAAKSAKHFADSLPRKLHSNFTGNLAKILNKKACPERSRRVLFLLRRRRKILKGVFAFL